MGKRTVRVIYVYTDNKDTVVGARLLEESKFFDVDLDRLRTYKDRLLNATMTASGDLQARKGYRLDRQVLTLTIGELKPTFTLMHGDEAVCKLYYDTNKVEIIKGELLPFALKSRVLSALDIMRWLDKRVGNFTRVYMQKLYWTRRVGHDMDKVVADSAAISIIDNYWVKCPEINTTWGELNKRRDDNLNLVNVLLTGRVDEFEHTKGTTSMYTIKGAYPKAVYNGYLLKYGNNAHYETIAYNLGNYLGINTAEAVEVPASGYISDLEGQITKCTLFTSTKVSMVHAGDLLPYTDYPIHTDEHRALYEFVERLGRKDLVYELERLYLFNYLVLNTDFHYENFGLLYSPETLSIVTVAPAYDFNNAFEPNTDPRFYYPWIVANLPKFIKNNISIRHKLESPDFDRLLKDLTDEQKQAIDARRQYLISFK